MRRFGLLSAVVVALIAPALRAQSADGPYTVLKRARVGGEGGWDYINADPVDRRLYIPRGGPGRGSTDASYGPRIMVYNLDNLDSVGVVMGVQGNGAVADPKSGHGFASTRPTITMFDTKTLAVLSRIPYDSGFGPDGILLDKFNDRVYVFSHPTRNAMVIDSRNGTALGYIDVGGPPEQGVADGKGTLYVVRQDTGSVTVIDAKSMKPTAHYSLVDKAGCNGLALDVKNKILFAACGRVLGGPAPMPGMAMPSQATVTVLSATDGKILATLPLPGGSDGMAFNPATMEAFSTGGGILTVVKEASPTSFEVEQNLPTMPGSRTIAFDPKTGHVFTMSQERGPAPPPPENLPPGGRGPGAPAIPGSFTILMIGR
jgi:DNA-binding beta-propeller fold protein YncE